MARPQPHRARVVLTGTRGSIAEAVQRAFRSRDVTLAPLRRGDDLAGFVASGDTVVVLDAARPSGSADDYIAALHAISSASEASKIRRVVSVTSVRPQAKQRRAFLARQKEAERQLRAYGIALTVIRCGVVIGTSDVKGPADRLLLARFPVLFLPGRGSQRVRPITVTELADRVVKEAFDDEPANVDVNAEGTESLSLDDFARELNGNAVHLVHVPRAVFGALATVAVIVAVFSPVALAVTSSPVAWQFGSMLVAYLIAVWSFVMYMRLGLLPEKDFLLEDAPNDDVTPTPPELPLRQQRRARAKSRKFAKRYGAEPGAAWNITLLVVIGVAALAVGSWDFVAEPSFGGKVTNAFLVLAGFTMCVGGVALSRVTWPPRYAIGFLAAVVAAATVGTVAVSSLRSPDSPAGIKGALGYLFLFCVVTCIQLWRRGALVLASFVGTRGIAWFSSLILGGTVVGATQFLYSNVYAPSISRPGVSVTANAKLLGLSPNGKYLSFGIALHNFTSSQVYLLGTSFRVSGETAVPAQPTSVSYRRITPTVDELGQAELSYSMRVTGTRVLEDGTLSQLGDFLEAGQTLEREVVVSIPREFALARLTVSAASMRLDGRNGLTDFAQTNLNSAAVSQDAEINDPSLLHRLTRHARYVHSVWLRPENPAATQLLCVQGALTIRVDDSPGVDSDGCPLTPVVTGQYDIVFTNASIESAANLRTR